MCRVPALYGSGCFADMGRVGLTGGSNCYTRLRSATMGSLQCPNAANRTICLVQPDFILRAVGLRILSAA